MNTISDIMFWISNGLLVPDVVLLILLGLNHSDIVFCIHLRCQHWLLM